MHPHLNGGGLVFDSGCQGSQADLAHDARAVILDQAQLTEKVQDWLGDVVQVAVGSPAFAFGETNVNGNGWQYGALKGDGEGVAFDPGEVFGGTMDPTPGGSPDGVGGWWRIHADGCGVDGRAGFDDVSPVGCGAPVRYSRLRGYRSIYANSPQYQPDYRVCGRRSRGRV